MPDIRGRGLAAFKPAAHDLLWIADSKGLQNDRPLPGWITAYWLAQAPLVVRRDRSDQAGLIPVGLRGSTRSQRFGVWLAPEAVLKSMTPEDVARQALWKHRDDLASLPALQTLAELAPRLDQSGLVWGPTGSVGFQLASGLPVLRTSSDLDLLVRAASEPSAAQTELLQTLCRRAACRLDIQIDTGHGGFSLTEWLRSGANVLLRTDHGPVLTADPWRTMAPAGGTAA